MISRFIRRIFTDVPANKPVGRWRLNDGDAFLRANLANMDCCGDNICGDPKKFNQVIDQYKKTTSEPLKRSE